MPKADTESTAESSNNTAESDLHPKHRQTLLDAYNKADWLCGTLDSSQYIEVPSHLKSIRNSLEGLLTEQGLLDHLSVCTYCGFEIWASENPRTTQRTCPECESRMKYANTRPVTPQSNGDD